MDEFDKHRDNLKKLCKALDAMGKLELTNRWMEIRKSVEFAIAMIEDKQTRDISDGLNSLD